MIKDSKNIYTHTFYNDLKKKINGLDITYTDFKKIYKRSKIVYCYDEDKFIGYLIYEISKSVEIYNGILFINPVYLHYAAYNGDTLVLFKELTKFLDRQGIMFTSFVWYRFKKKRYFILRLNRGI